MRLYVNRQGLAKGKKARKPRARAPSKRSDRPTPTTAPAPSWPWSYPSGRRAVPRAEVRGQRRQRLRRQERPAAPARERGPDQPGRIQGGAVPAGAAAAAKRRGRPQERGAAARNGRLGGRPDHAWEELVRPVRPARDAAGQDDPGLYYKAGKDRLLTIVLARDATGAGPTICSTARAGLGRAEILSHYAALALEVMHFNAKQMMGLEDPANRTPLAVQRTAPVGLVLYGLTWCGSTGRAIGRWRSPTGRGIRGRRSRRTRTSWRGRRESWRGQFAGVDWEQGGEETPLAQLIEFVSRAA